MYISPLEQKFHTAFKNDFKKPHIISQEGTIVIIFAIEISGEMTFQIIKTVWEKWPKFEQVKKKYRPLGRWNF